MFFFSKLKSAKDASNLNARSRDFKTFRAQNGKMLLCWLLKDHFGDF